MSTRPEFPFLENALDSIRKSEEIFQLQEREKGKRIEILRHLSSTEEEFQWRVSKIDESSLIDRDVDYSDVNSTVKKIVENPRYRPWLHSGSVVKHAIMKKKTETISKYAAPKIKSTLKRIQDGTENPVVNALTQIAYSAIKSKLGF